MSAGVILAFGLVAGSFFTLCVFHREPGIWPWPVNFALGLGYLAAGVLGAAGVVW